jgi:hypothetical protein
VTFGPWRPELPDAERVAQLRCLAGLAAVFRGSNDPLALRAAALALASEPLQRLPALVKRKLLCTFGAVPWPAKQRAGAK